MDSNLRCYMHLWCWFLSTPTNYCQSQKTIVNPDEWKPQFTVCFILSSAIWERLKYYNLYILRIISLFKYFLISNDGNLRLHIPTQWHIDCFCTFLSFVWLFVTEIRWRVSQRMLTDDSQTVFQLIPFDGRPPAWNSGFYLPPIDHRIVPAKYITAGIPPSGSKDFKDSNKQMFWWEYFATVHPQPLSYVIQMNWPGGPFFGPKL